MAWTQADIDDLKKAIGSGARTVKFGAGSGSREITYNSIDEMLKALGVMEAEVNGGSSGYVLVDVGRGFRRPRGEGWE